MGAKELDAIAKRVKSKCPIEARNGFGVVLYFEAGGSQRFEKIGEFSHEKRGMRLLRRAKLRLNTEVQLQRATPKPSAAAIREIRRLGNFR